MAIQDGRWAPGIGDPTVMGWVTVAIYFAVALLCTWAAIRTSANKDNTVQGQDKALSFFWFSLSVLLILLGINKQFDLQSLLTQVGKDLAIAQGWYEKRRTVQFLFIIFIAASGVGVLALLVRKYWAMLDYIKITLIGCVILFIFILIRAMSFHHVDIFIHTKLAGIKMNWLFEIGGLSVIWIGALNYLRRIKTRSISKHS
ncbi:MAG: hypothetical protein P8Y24_03380 [Gammaproteobacteria bacterium]